MIDRRTIRELRAHANKVPGFGHLVAHEMVDEIEELRGKLSAVRKKCDDWSDLQYIATAEMFRYCASEVRKILDNATEPETALPTSIPEPDPIRR